MPDFAKTQQFLYKESPDAWQTKVQVWARIPFPLPWMLIAGVVFLIGYFFVIFFGDNLNAIGLLAIESALIAAIANSVVLFEKLLDDVADAFPILLDEKEEEVNEWLSRWYKNIFWSNSNVLMGLILGILCGAHNFAQPFETIVGRAYAYIILFLVAFLGGSMFWTMLGIARLTSSLGKDVKIKLSIFDSKSSAFRAASSVLWKVSITASLVYMLALSIYYFGLIECNAQILVIVLIFGMFIILYFIIPQINIHKTLMSIKRSKIEALVKQIDHTFNNVAAQPNPQNINQLRDLFQLQRIVNGKKSWSFGTAELLMLTGSVLVPLLLFAIGYFLRKGN